MLKTALEWENLRFIKLQREPSGGTPKGKVGGSNPFWRAIGESDLCLTLFFCYSFINQGFEPARVDALRKRSCGAFLASIGERHAREPSKAKPLAESLLARHRRVRFVSDSLFLFIYHRHKVYIVRGTESNALGDLTSRIACRRSPAAYMPAGACLPAMKTPCEP